MSGEISVETYRGTRRILAAKDIVIRGRVEGEEIERLRQEADAYMKEKRYQDAEVALNAILQEFRRFRFHDQPK